MSKPSQCQETVFRDQGEGLDFQPLIDCVQMLQTIWVSSRAKARLVLNVVKELKLKILRLRLRTLRGFLAALEMTRVLNETVVRILCVVRENGYRAFGGNR